MSDPIFGQLLVDFNSLKPELTKRKKLSDFQRIHPKLLDEFEADGWSFFQKLTNDIKIQKPKKHDELLENEVWLLFYKMGFKELNQGRKFTITFKRGGKAEKKQIDVFAKDDETVVVLECKSSKTITNKRSLQKDLEEWGNLREPISNAIREHYGKTFKPKILWAFCTKNIKWSPEDEARAKNQNIYVLKDRELRYLKQITDHIGVSAKYQFLAEYFSNQKIPELEGHKVPAFRGSIGGNSFYSFITTPEDLLKISFVNHRALSDPEGFPTYQRLMTKSALTKIREFIKNGGYFPTNLLINFTVNIRFEKVSKDSKTGIQFGYMYFPALYKSAWVIDGQHRLYGYATLDKKLKRQNIFVLAFEKLETKKEADLFVTINSEQKNVQRGLLDELVGDLKWDSDKPTEKISAVAAKIIQTLNADLTGPFYERVTAQGVKGNEVVCLTVTGLKNGIRSSGVIGKVNKNKQLEPGIFSEETNTETLNRAARGISDFFQQIRKASPEIWDMGKSGTLCTNTGFNGWLNLFSSLVQEKKHKFGKDFTKLTHTQILKEIEDYLEPALEFLREGSPTQIQNYLRVPFGSGGPKVYFYKLVKLVKQTHPSFNPPGFEEWVTKEQVERLRNAEEMTKWIQAVTLQYIFETFITKFGKEDSLYFYEAIQDTEAATKAHKRFLEVPKPERLSLENYLDFIDLKKILRKGVNVPLFDEIFNIKEPGGHEFEWLDKINELRRIPAHPNFNRKFKEEDYIFLEVLGRELKARLKTAAEKKDSIAKSCLLAKFE